MDLRKKRREMDLSQFEVAKAIGISRYWYIKIEHGDVKRLSADVAMRLAKLYGCSVEDVMSA